MKKEETVMNNWTTTWPTTPGWYWAWLDNVTRPVEVKIAGGDRPFIVYISDGEFLHKDEFDRRDHKVFWLPLPTPEPPENI